MTSDPIEAFLSTLSTWKVEIDVTCDENQENPLYEVKPTVTSGSVHEIKFTLPYSRGCGVHEAKTPTPTPEYTPQCEYDARMPDEPLKGISMDVRETNGGPFGHMYFDNINKTDYFIFYQPCERSKNPARPYDYTDNELASVWLCNDEITSCRSLGIVDNYTKMEIVPNDFTQPVYQHILSDTNNKSTVYWTCDSSLPRNQILFNEGKLSDKGAVLDIKIKSRQSCVESMAPVQPSKDQCVLNYMGYNFNASTLNNPGNTGYVQDVTVIHEHGTSEQLLYFQPCGSIFCPKNADCDQFEDATVWLCKKRGHIGSNADEYDCDAYGLAENPIKTTFAYASNPEAGIQMEYDGGDYLGAKVVYECDNSMPTGEIRLDNTVEILGSTLYLTVRTNAACGGKDPAKRFYLTWPQRGPTPTPTPLQHPQPNLFIGNSTHYIIVDLNDADQKIDEQKFLAAYHGKYTSITHFYAPFTEFKCPSGYDCKEFTDFQANGWMCWVDEAGKRVCFPDATIMNPMSIRPLNDQGLLDHGATITYNGAYDVDLQINVKCNLKAARDIPLQDAPSYDKSISGNEELSFTTTSSMTCPYKYRTPYTPRTRPTPTPNPDIIKNVKWNVDLNEDGKMIEVDLNRVPRTVADVSLGYGYSYERHTLLWSPIERVPCLENYDCQGFQDSNVWKCFVNSTNQRQCYPIGNAEYGMSIELAPNIKGIHADAAVEYKGGLNGRITFFMVCNHSVPSKGVWIDPVGEQHFSAGQSVIVYAHSQHVCYNKHVDDDFDKTSGGAVFLTLVSFGTIAYVIIGGIVMFFITGTMGLPHSSFWTEFFECVKTGAIFIGTCGKRRTSSNVRYDDI